ncbi:MAG: sulfatase-like hydrolase/transferase [Solirubrobacterales bacterium]|nr:sulfatase-like hydrolase/transferase [Solirubrobacterales bacterium]
MKRRGTGSGPRPLLGPLGMIVAVLLVGTIWAAPGAGAAPGNSRPPVVVIVLDEFPTTALINQAGAISPARFPNFSRLSREASWYPNHTTVSQWTYNAVPAILGGNYAPAQATLPDFGNYQQNLFTWSDAGGYRIDAEETATQLCPASICRDATRDRLEPSRFNTPLGFLRAKVAQHVKRSRANVLSRIRRLKIRPGRMVFRHLLLPHHPYSFLPDGRRYPNGPIPASPWGGLRVTQPIGNVRLGYQRMMLQIGYVDRMIGQLRRNALRQGKWKSMMLVVTGDHGIEHRPGFNWREVNARNLGSIAFAPLFIKYPGRLRGGRSTLATQAVDILPTIAREVGIKIPAGDGRPISDLSAEPRPVRMDAATFPFDQAVRSRNRAIRYRNGLLGRGGLFRLGPRRDLIGRRPGAVRLSGVNASLDSPGSYGRVRRGAASVPAMVTGTVRGIRAGRIVAVTVNGVIRGTAQVFRDGRKRRFGAMVDPATLRSRNRIRILLVR